MDVAVVTGSSGRIGSAIVQRLVADGWFVAGVDATGDEAPAWVGDRAVAHRVDVSDAAQVETLFADLARTHGAPRAVVNNAAVFPRASAVDATPGDWLRVVEINLGGSYLCSAALARHLAAERGAIVNLGSQLALKGGVGVSAYAASKGGIAALTRALAVELAPRIRVNCVVPGVVDSAQTRAGGFDDGDFERLGEQTPLGRLTAPEDVAAAVRFLLSDEAGQITGQSLMVNGGAVMQ